MNHDSKHREIDTEVKAKEPRRAMEQVLELDEANETVRWSSRPCEGRPEGSGQELPARLVSIPNKRGIQDGLLFLGYRMLFGMYKNFGRYKKLFSGSKKLFSGNKIQEHQQNYKNTNINEKNKKKSDFFLFFLFFLA